MTRNRDIAANATGSAPTLVDAKGDIVVGTADNVAGRLAVGDSGSTLVADSSATTGLRWQGNFAAGKNKIINGDFNIWQRGTSFTGNEIYTADRWYYLRDGSGAATISRQSFATGTAPVAGYESSFFFRFNQTTAGTGATYSQFQHPIEDVRVFAGQTVTLSLWAKADTSRSIGINLRQDFGTGGSSGVSITGGTASLTTSWVRYSYTVSVPAITGATVGTNSSLRFIITFPVNTTQTIDIWGVQLEAGNTATAFQTATGTLAGELAACQRYYFKVGPGTENYAPIAMGMFNSAGTAVQAQVYFPQQLRIKPSSIDSSNLRAQDISNGYSMTSVTLENSSSASVGRISATVSGATAFRSCFIDGGTGAGYLAFNAEL